MDICAKQRQMRRNSRASASILDDVSCEQPCADIVPELCGVALGRQSGVQVGGEHVPAKVVNVLSNQATERGAVDKRTPINME